MKGYPNWAPDNIVERIQEFEELIRIGNRWPTIDFEYKLWRRLATRPEMESIWNFIADTAGTKSLLTNGGLSGKLNRAIRRFHGSPRFSPSDYKNEMLEIAKLADALSNKLKKFCDADFVFNPFSYAGVFTHEQLKQSFEALGQESDEKGSRWRMGFNLDHCMPAFDVQIKGISNRAKAESLDQLHKMRLPRKVNDKNLFRTYFIQIVGDYFFLNCADYSPVRLATFCSVALDDEDITPDLTRKIYELDDECRALIEAQRTYMEKED